MENNNKKWVLLLSSFFDFIYLNLIWLLFSLPLLTVFPATSALFGVIRKWKQQHEINIFSTYYEVFKDNLKTSMNIGLLWTIVFLLLFIDLQLVIQLPETLQLVGFAVLGLLFILFTLTSLYMFSVIVHFDTNTFGVIKNAFLLAVLNPMQTFFKLIISCVILYLVIRVPLTIFIVGSVSAYYLYTVDHKIFDKYKKPKENSLDLVKEN